MVASQWPIEEDAVPEEDQKNIAPLTVKKMKRSSDHALPELAKLMRRFAIMCNYFIHTFTLVLLYFSYKSNPFLTLFHKWA